LVGAKQEETGVKPPGYGMLKMVVGGGKLQTDRSLVLLIQPVD
jgi:hypothetical protein